MKIGCDSNEKNDNSIATFKGILLTSDKKISNLEDQDEESFLNGKGYGKNEKGKVEDRVKSPFLL
jgi:hypothetical protein